MMSDKQKIAELELRIQRLEQDLSALRSNFNGTPKTDYEPIPSYFPPDFKILLSP